MTTAKTLDGDDCGEPVGWRLLNRREEREVGKDIYSTCSLFPKSSQILEIPTSIAMNLDSRAPLSLSDADTVLENVSIGNQPCNAGIEKGTYEDSKVPFMTARTRFMCILVSMGEICFGYDTGQV